MLVYGLFFRILHSSDKLTIHNNIVNFVTQSSLIDLYPWPKIMELRTTLL